MREIIQVKTRKKTEFLDITKEIGDLLSRESIKEGVIVLYTKHTTTGLSINENEEGLVADMEEILRKLVPPANYRHDRIDNNAESHLRSILLGQHLVIPFIDGRLELGSWQRIFFVELDGPRTRNLIVRVMRD
ncbi:MAG: secondary thiamine-phosphate synthase enzyme YjbQ [Candidatus Altiarchaeota archaeon]|nr:secondary thiamine-phosphate synthase enzyme YjbQ [Candidatus Altiarchaeota archaeon]